MSSYGRCRDCNGFFTDGVGGLCRRCYDMRRLHKGLRVIGRSRQCPMCGVWFELQRTTARFCSPACRLRWHRQHPGQPAPSGLTNVACLDDMGRIVNLRQPDPETHEQTQ